MRCPLLRALPDFSDIMRGCTAQPAQKSKNDRLQELAIRFHDLPSDDAIVKMVTEVPASLLQELPAVYANKFDKVFACVCVCVHDCVRRFARGCECKYVCSRVRLCHLPLMSTF